MLRCYRPVTTELLVLATFLSIRNQRQHCYSHSKSGGPVRSTILKKHRIPTAKRQRVVVKFRALNLYQLKANSSLQTWAKCFVKLLKPTGKANKSNCKNGKGVRVRVVELPLHVGC